MLCRLSFFTFHTFTHEVRTHIFFQNRFYSLQTQLCSILYLFYLHSLFIIYTIIILQNEALCTLDFYYKLGYVQLRKFIYITIYSTKWGKISSFVIIKNGDLPRRITKQVVAILEKLRPVILSIDQVSQPFVFVQMVDGVILPSTILITGRAHCIGIGVRRTRVVNE